VNAGSMLVSQDFQRIKAITPVNPALFNCYCTNSQATAKEYHYGKICDKANDVNIILTILTFVSVSNQNPAFY
jgi:hypothetical protein